ncbi:MAG TPA: enoyl-CoA hydratase-related protein [Pseudomonadales bacterium]|nr:enoyl-CoA hydratase-related protein [Pseudomonadales bacterium]
MSTSYTALLFEITNGIARITLNRPDDANGMDMTMGRELMDVALRCDQDENIRVVVLTGAGNFFSAGGDLKAFADYGDAISERIHELTIYLHAAIGRFVRMRVPVIVAVNGVAAGAGFSLAMAGDFVLASESARFTMAYTAAGLSPDGGASYFLPRLVGLRRAQELMISNRRLSAEEALDWGLVTRVCATDGLMAEVQDLALQLASGATQAIGTVKKLLAVSYENGLEAQMALEGQGIAHLAACCDGQEGIHAFLAKRRPVFTGK